MYRRSLNFTISNYARENDVSLSFPATTTKAYKVIKGHKQEEKQGKIFICPWIMAEYKGRSSKKVFLFPCLFLAWQYSWLSAAPFKSDYLIFRNDFTKETAAYREAAHRMFHSPSTPKYLGWALRMSRTKPLFVLHHKRGLLISFTIPIPCCFLSHAACPEVNSTIWRLHQSHSYYSTMWVSLLIPQVKPLNHSL